MINNTNRDDPHDGTGPFAHKVKGDVKAYETPLVEVQDISEPNRKAAVFQIDVPLTELKPGFYTAQVNVIDDAGGHFLFPRVAMLVRAEQPVAITPAPASKGKTGS